MFLFLYVKRLNFHNLYVFLLKWWQILRIFMSMGGVQPRKPRNSKLYLIGFSSRKIPYSLSLVKHDSFSLLWPQLTYFLPVLLRTLSYRQVEWEISVNWWSKSYRKTSEWLSFFNDIKTTIEDTYIWLVCEAIGGLSVGNDIFGFSTFCLNFLMFPFAHH